MARRQPTKIREISTNIDFLLESRLQAEDYTSYYDTTPGNIGGVYRDDDVDIEPSSDFFDLSTELFNVGWIVEGEWLTYDVDILQSGIYQFSPRVASALDTTHSLDISIDGQTTTLSFDGTGGWQSWETVTSEALYLTAGSHTLRLDMGSSGFNLNYIEYDFIALIGDDRDDSLYGGDRDDSLYGGDGHDSLYGGDGHDSLYGEFGSDSLYGEFGSDSLYGGDGDDSLYGGDGHDDLYGGDGHDTLYGGGYSQAIDELTEEIDYLTGGSGSDVFVIGDSAGFAYQGGDSNDTEDYSFALVTDFSAADDFIQAYGSSSNYELDYGEWYGFSGFSNQDTGIYVGDDLLAVIQDTTVDNFDKFIFVSDVFI